jgi:glycerol 2-dehydrogenase (NADP+)
MWSLQRDTSIIPKSVTPLRIDSNFQLDGWALSDEQMRSLDSMKTRFKVVNDSWMPIKVFFGDDD